MSLLLDPKIFNYVILILYALNVIRWTWERSVGDAVYWIGAFVITFSITFLYKN